MKNNIFNILKKEMREVFRDKKSLGMMLIIPIMIPLIIIGMSSLFENQMNQDIKSYNQLGFSYQLSDTEQEILKNLGINATVGNEEELKKKFQDGDIYLYITKTENTYTINYSESDESSSYASMLADAYLNSYKTYLQGLYLEANSLDNTVLNIISIDYNNIEDKNFFADYIINYAFLFIIMAITVSATYPATDTTAGEKERGTLETLLTFPIRSRDIIIGKFLTVSLSSIITGILSLILALVSLKIVNGMFSIYEGANVMLSVPALVGSIFVILAYSFLISGLCIAIASKSKTFKEAQSALTPLTFISFFPGMIAFMMSIKATPILSLVPFLNFSLTFTDISEGVINYLNIFIVVISTFVYILIVIYIIVKQYKTEKVLFNS